MNATKSSLHSFISDTEKPACDACGLLCEDHFGSIEAGATYFCNRSVCKKARKALSCSIESVFNDYETDFLDDAARLEAEEARAFSLSCANAAEAHRERLVLKGSALYRKLRREWPEATDEAITSVTIERARKAKPSQWGELIRDHKYPAHREPVRDSELRFQKYANDSVKWRSKCPEGTNHIPGARGGVPRLIQDMGGSEKNRGWGTLDTGDVMRQDTPKWIKDENSIEEFLAIRSRKASQILDDEIVYSWQIGRVLDGLILKDYYFGRHSDQQIFEEYKKLFVLERYPKVSRVDLEGLSEMDSVPKNSRWTCSADAVKHRRVRLLRERNQLFGTRNEWSKNSWRGIIVSYIARDIDGEWYREIGGFGTREKRRDALFVAEDAGYTGRFPGELADLIEEKTFDDLEGLNRWMAKNGLIPRDSKPKESPLDAAA